MASKGSTDCIVEMKIEEERNLFRRMQCRIENLEKRLKNDFQSDRKTLKIGLFLIIRLTNEFEPKVEVVILLTDTDQM